MPSATTLRASLLIAVLAVLAAACAGGNEAADGARPQVGERKMPPPPPRPKTFVRVVDGDTGAPVRGARVAAAGLRERTGRTGTAVLPLARRRVTFAVSAPRYGAERVRVRFRSGLRARLAIYRPALQWPVYGGNAARTQAQTSIRLRPPYRVVWTRTLRGLLEFPAVVWHGVAYVNNIHGYVTALRMRDGKRLWRRRVGSLMASSPGVDPERRALVTTSMIPGNVSVLSLATGRVRWRFSTGRAEPSPAIRDGVAYFGSTAGNVYALDLDRRRPRWVHHGGVKVTGSPALAGGRVYFGDYAGRVFALDARNGRLVWRGSAGGRVYGTAAVGGGRVFVPSVFSGLSAFSAKTGRFLWRIPTGAYLYSSPAYFHGRVYFGSYARVVYCADAASGRILWTRPAGGAVSGAVEVVGDVVYAAATSGRITAWHWKTGRVLWRFAHGDYVPVSANGRMLLLHGVRRIWAVVPKRASR